MQNLMNICRHLHLNSKGAWLIIWNDDAFMDTKDWDKEIVVIQDSLNY